jgi:hypothetical protein
MSTDTVCLLIFATDCLHFVCEDINYGTRLATSREICGRVSKWIIILSKSKSNFSWNADHFNTALSE